VLVPASGAVLTPLAVPRMACPHHSVFCLRRKGSHSGDPSAAMDEGRSKKPADEAQVKKALLRPGSWPLPKIGWLWAGRSWAGQRLLFCIEDNLDHRLVTHFQLSSLHFAEVVLHCPTASGWIWLGSKAQSGQPVQAMPHFYALHSWSGSLRSRPYWPSLAHS